MNFTGIPLATLLSAGAAVGAIVVVFYILRLRRRPIAVPFAPLWQKILRDKEATSFFSQLKRLLSLLLQLALLAALLLALGDPRPAVSKDEGRHVVVLIDASASMKAIDVDQEKAQPAAPTSSSQVEWLEGVIPRAVALPKPTTGAAVPVAPQVVDKGDEGPVKRTRLDEGKDRIRQVIRGLAGSDRLLVAQLDAAVTPLSTMTGEVPELEAALERVRPTDVRAHFARGLRFAVDSLRGLSKPEIILVSDGALGEPADTQGTVELGDVRLTHVAVGRSDRNVAVTGFSVRRYPLDKSRYEVLLEVTNTSEQPEDVDIELFGDGQLTDIVSLRLDARESLSRFYPNLSGADRTLEARISLRGGQKDDLPADDHAYALLPERRRARVQVVSEGNMYLEAALLLDEYLDVVNVKPGAYPGDGVFDVTIFDNVAPLVADGSGHILYLNPSGEHLPFEVGKEIVSDRFYKLGFDEIETQSPLVRHLVLGDVQVARGFPLRGDKDDKIVGASFKGTLLLSGRRRGQKFVALGFDLRESDLPLRIAWPLLLLNIINDFIEEDASYISSFQTGQVWNIPADPQAATAEIVLPQGERRVVPIKDGRAVFLGQHAGFYELASTVGDDEPVRSMFAANLSDPVESAIAPVASVSVGGKQAGEIEGFEIGVRHELWVYLIGAVLLVTALEWLTYHRRLTV